MYYKGFSHRIIALFAAGFISPLTANAYDDREDPALVGATLNDAVLREIWEAGAPSIREANPPSRADFCPAPLALS